MKETISPHSIVTLSLMLVAWLTHAQYEHTNCCTGVSPEEWGEPFYGVVTILYMVIHIQACIYECSYNKFPHTNSLLN